MILFIFIHILGLECRAYIEKSDRKSFRPSLQLSTFNDTTFASSTLPMQPLSSKLNRAQERLSITFQDDIQDIGNIDYTSSYYGGHQTGQKQRLEADMRKVRTLLQLEDDPLYYDSISFTPEDIRHNFVPSAPSPLPTTAEVTPDVDIVVKGLPGAGPRLTGAKTTFSPPLVYHRDHLHGHPHTYNHDYNSWSHQRPICDDKVINKYKILVNLLICN